MIKKSIAPWVHLHVDLVKALVTDLFVYHKAVLLLIAIAASAYGVVYQTHLYRDLYKQQASVQKERERLDVEWRHLVIEQRTLSEHSRIEHIATTRLGLIHSHADQEVFVPW